MEEKEKFLNTIEAVNEDGKILQDWMVEANAKMKYEDDMNASKQKGIEKGQKQIIENILAKGYSLEEVASLTGKSLEEIENIIKTNANR